MYIISNYLLFNFICHLLKQMKGSLYLGQFAKVKIFVHWTFFILVSYSLFLGVLMEQHVENLGWNMLFILAIFLCILLHEFGHVVTGHRFGYKTKDIIILPIGGMSRFEKLPDSPKEEFLISVSGPFVNLLIALILFLIQPYSLSNFPYLDISELNSKNFLFLLCEVNFFISIFNLIPAFPMDGGRVLRAILSLFMSKLKATGIASSVGTVLSISLIFLGIFFNPFLIVIGLFIIFSTSNKSSVVNISELLEGHTAGELAMHKFDMLYENLTIAEASKEVLDHQSKNIGIVSEKDEIIGTISRDMLISSLQSHDLKTPLSKIMNPITDVIPSKTLLKDLLNDKIFKNYNLVPVTENEKIIGMINLENILEFMAFKKASPDWENIINEDGLT